MIFNFPDLMSCVPILDGFDGQTDVCDSEVKFANKNCDK